MKVRLVWMPCLDRFEAQDQAYRPRGQRPDPWDVLPVDLERRGRALPQADAASVRAGDPGAGRRRPALAPQRRARRGLSVRPHRFATMSRASDTPCSSESAHVTRSDSPSTPRRARGSCRSRVGDNVWNAEQERETCACRRSVTTTRADDSRSMPWRRWPAETPLRAHIEDRRARRPWPRRGRGAGRAAVRRPRGRSGGPSRGTSSPPWRCRAAPLAAFASWSERASTSRSLAGGGGGGAVPGRRRRPARGPLRREPMLGERAAGLVADEQGEPGCPPNALRARAIESSRERDALGQLDDVVVGKSVGQTLAQALMPGQRSPRLPPPCRRSGRPPMRRRAPAV